MSDHVSDWRKSYCYQGTPIKDRDRVYLKCYAGGDAGYVARYEHTTPSSTTLVQMQGASRVEIKDAKSEYYATWTPESFKAQNAVQFIAHVKDGHIWFESDILGGHQEVVSCCKQCFFFDAFERCSEAPRDDQHGQERLRVLCSQ